MLKKKYIFENDKYDEMDINDLSDHQKIMLLAKNKIDYRYVDFYDPHENYSEFENVLEVTKDGFVFNFEGLEEFLIYFFDSVYNSDDGKYEASYFESMYSGSWDWNEHFYDRVSEDFYEGDINVEITTKYYDLLLNLVKKYVPDYYKKNIKYDCDDDCVKGILELFDLKDSYIDIEAFASSNAVHETVKKGIQDIYCDCLKPFGVYNIGRHCFNKYIFDWESCLILFARYGTGDENILKLLFDTISKDREVDHLPEYFEMSEYYWDQSKYLDTIKKETQKMIKELTNKLDSEEYKKYIKNLNLLIKYFDKINKWKTSKNGMYTLKIDNFDFTKNANYVDFRFKKLNDPNYSAWTYGSLRTTTVKELIHYLITDEEFKLT